MNILLTGSDGFIGQHLYKHLIKQHSVIGLDLQYGDDILTCELPNNIDLVIHLAGLSGVRDSLERPTEYWKTNVIGGQRLFDVYKDTRIIYASSSTAHEPWKNPYAMSKYCLEQVSHKNSLGMRFTTVYGPNARENMLIPKILRNDVEFLNVNHSRDFIHVDDIISSIDTVMSKPITGIIDVGTGVSNKLIDIAQHFKIDYLQSIGDETERLYNTADTTILNTLGWKTKVNLYQYIEENRNVN
jgi:nucleoside-diphosphate-sugar epimerase